MTQEEMQRDMEKLIEQMDLNIIKIKIALQGSEETLCQNP